MITLILGVPKGKLVTKENLITFANMQSAATGCENPVSVTAADEDDAKAKYIEIAARNFQPTNQ